MSTWAPSVAAEARSGCFSATCAPRALSISHRLRPQEAALRISGRGGEDAACSTELAPVSRESAAERRGGAGGSDPSRSRTPSGPTALQGVSREPWLSTLWFSPGLRLPPGLGTEGVSRCLCPCDSPPVPVCKGARSLQRTHPQPNLRILVGVAQTWGRSRGRSTCASPAAPRRFRSAPRAQGPLRSRAPLTPPRLVRYMALQMAPLPHFNITVYGSLSRPRGNYIYLAFITYISTRRCHCVLLSVLC